jgi:hypothetical protein
MRSTKKGLGGALPPLSDVTAASNARVKRHVSAPGAWKAYNRFKLIRTTSCRCLPDVPSFLKGMKPILKGALFARSAGETSVLRILQWEWHNLNSTLSNW